MYIAAEYSDVSRLIMRAARIVLLVVGGIILLTSFGLLVGGVVLYRVNTSLTDNQGFISSAGQRFAAASYAITTQDVNINIGTGTDWRIWRPSVRDLITVRITTSSNSPVENVFLGIANATDAQAYLSNVQYDEVVGLEFNPGSSPNVEYRPHQGSTTPVNRLSQAFWVSSAHGAGTQTLEWKPQTGTYWIVLMNEDGSAGLDDTVSLGARIPLLSTIGLGLVLGGIVGLAVGVIMLYFGARR
jgi:hypothetical protein